MQQAILKAGEGTRTLDIQLGKLALYQLSYARSAVLWERKQEPRLCTNFSLCSNARLLFADCRRA
jgi:hypothetical protein